MSSDALRVKDQQKTTSRLRLRAYWHTDAHEAVFAQVKLVAHSMGGLVIKCFMTMYPEVKKPCIHMSCSVSPLTSIHSHTKTHLHQPTQQDASCLVTKCVRYSGISPRCPHTYTQVFEERVDALITIGTPHQGAGAKIYMELLQGYNLGTADMCLLCLDIEE